MTDLGEIVSFVTTESPIKSDASALSIVSATAGLKVRVLAAEPDRTKVAGIGSGAFFLCPVVFVIVSRSNGCRNVAVSVVLPY